MKIQLLPYKISSKSCKALKKELQSLGNDVVISLKNNPGRSRINWGNYNIQHNCLNKFASFAINKVVSMIELEIYGVPSLAWTLDKSFATTWFNEGKTVVVRKILNGSKGKGILIWDKTMKGQELPDAPLYTLYQPKQKEFRVYVFHDTVTDVLEKRKRKGFESPDNRIRSYDKGWVFCRENVVEPEGLRQLAINAVAALSLDFGGVDIIWSKKENKLLVVEVNTAPGIQNTSTKNLAKAMHDYINQPQEGVQ